MGYKLLLTTPNSLNGTLIALTEIVPQNYTLHLAKIKKRRNDKMAWIPKSKFKLVSEEDMYKLIEEKPELASQTFDGFCTWTDTHLIFGPLTKEVNQCACSLPDNHLVMMPIEFLNQEPADEKLPVLHSISYICTQCRKGSGD